MRLGGFVVFFGGRWLSLESVSDVGGIPDIFIPPTTIGNAGGMSGRNENSGMTRFFFFGGDSVPCPCGGGSFRSGIQSPTGAGGGGRFSALAGVERSGRGCNPRPALLPTGTPQLALPDRHSTSGIRYFRIWNCRQTFGRGGAFRPCAGRGLYPRPERSTPAKYLPCFQIRKSIAAINLSNCFLSSVALLSRGWIVPVGGATPDRHSTGIP